MRKRIIAAVASLAMMFAFAGCNMATVNEERDNAQVIIEIGDQKVLKGDLIDDFNDIVEMYSGLYGISTEELMSESNAEVMDSIINSIIETYTEELLVDIYAEKLNADLSLTEEQKKEVEDSLKENYDYFKEQAEQQINNDDSIKEEDKEAKIEELFNEALETSGYNDGSMKEDLESQYKITNMKNWLDKDYKATEDDLKEFYEKELAEQKKVLDETPSSISTYEQTGEVSLYVPEGLRYMQVLYVPMTDEYISQISSSRSDNKTDEADALRKTGLADIEADAKKALEAAKEDFDKAIETYGDDSTKKALEAAKEDFNEAIRSDSAKKLDYQGVRTYEGDTAYPDEVNEALFNMKSENEISDLIATDKGYYIIKYLGVMEPGDVALNDVHDELMEKMIADHKEDTYTTKLAEWKDENTIKTYPERLKA
ncbi:MAG: peptidylprolyl isomerase [Lachnospiraceae bacterium]